MGQPIGVLPGRHPQERLRRLQGRAYGFAYDDINDQSSVKILPNANPPTSLTIGIGW
ncbi:hypothetical protein [Nonomuraea insulae]|uniref:Uncharacterized protein n=1 Tax=Nonomuraea insulae TaxID=1616787 RepID=A0ABW1D539_9ACTN